MKARLLRKLLNDPGYTISNNEDYIAVGSGLCHDLISVDKKTLKIKYALDTWREGREALLKKNSILLLSIWDKLQELIDSGEIKDIIEGKDDIDPKLPVYTVKKGKLVKSYTDEYGWPNITEDGELMYDNTYFKTRIEAIEYGIREYESGAEMSKRRIEQIEEDLKKWKGILNEEIEHVKHLKLLK